MQNVSDMAEISVEKYKKGGVKSLWEYKTGSFIYHTLTFFIFLQNSLQDTIFDICALKFASYAHLIL